MKKYILMLGLLGLATTSLLSGCGKEEDDDAEHSHEVELITTLRLNFNAVNGGEPRSFNFQDLDGPGGNEPNTDTIELSANTNYNLTTEVLNESETPIEDTTIEIEEEAEEHQFFFEVSEGLNMTHAYNDTDANNDPIGLVNTVSTTTTSTGTMTVTLKHQPDNIKDGLITTGETDIEVSFPVVIQ